MPDSIHRAKASTAIAKTAVAIIASSRMKPAAFRRGRRDTLVLERLAIRGFCWGLSWFIA
jgi:hypothetical protein